MNFNYHGIEIADLSTWQDHPDIPGHVDYTEMREYGFDAVGIRAGIGDDEDVDFKINWQNARGILPRFTYFAYGNDVSPKVQANKYWDIIKGEREGPCAWDLEQRVGAGSYIWKSWYDCITEFQMRSGLSSDWIWIYTGLYYFEEFTMTATDAQREWFKQFPLWLATYTQDPFHPNYADIRCPRPWNICVMLQSGTPAIGLQAGVESKELDYNQWNGDETSFSKYFQTIDPGPEEPIMLKYRVVWANGATKRTSPNTGAAQVSVLPFGAVVEVLRDNIADSVYPSDPNKKWVELTDHTFAASIYGQNSVRMEKVEEPTPEPDPSLPAYFTAHDATGKELGRYIPE